jgi:hypothetical protein
MPMESHPCKKITVLAYAKNRCPTSTKLVYIKFPEGRQNLIEEKL